MKMGVRFWIGKDEQMEKHVEDSVHCQCALFNVMCFDPLL